MKKLVFLGPMKMIRKNNKGQAVIEYLLMFVFVASLVSVFYQKYNESFGRDGDILLLMNQSFQFSYRNAYGDPTGADKNTPNSVNYNDRSFHRSYVKSVGQTRFFGPNTRYPN